MHVCMCVCVFQHYPVIWEQEQRANDVHSYITGCCLGGFRKREKDKHIEGFGEEILYDNMFQKY